MEKQLSRLGICDAIIVPTNQSLNVFTCLKNTWYGVLLFGSLFIPFLFLYVYQKKERGVGNLQAIFYHTETVYPF